MNKPNRKFTPKQSGGERSERPRRPRSNEGSRAAGFSDKRYSPILDPDDNKEWQQRDEAGRRYRPAGQENASERPRRPRRDDDSAARNTRSGDTRKPGGYRSERTGGTSNRFKRNEDGTENKGFGRNSYRDDEKPYNSSKPAYGRNPRFSREEGTSGREGNSRPYRSSGEGRSSSGEKPNFNRRSEEGGARGGERNSERGGFRGGERSEFRPNRRDNDRSEGGNRSGENRSGENRSGENRYGGNSRTGGNRYGSDESSPRAEFRSPRRESGAGDEGRRSNSGRRGESRFNDTRFSESRSGDERPKRRSSERPSSEDQPTPPFKKKDFSERSSERSGRPGGKTPTPPDYEINKIKPKDEKVAHTTANIRLNKYIADSGICSRRDADTLIAEGKIKVNDEVVTQMGHKVSRNDVVTYNGKKINPEKLVYVLLNKPKDFITTTDDPQERRTVMQLVDDAADQRIYPVGRLDRNTTGLLLLTNDGELAEKLSHPSHQVKKVYQVLLDKPLADEDFEKIEQGVVLEDGPAPVDELSFVTPDKTVLGVELHIGRNRIVRRIFESLGYEVLGLDRVIYAGLTKKDLTRGHWRYLTQKEVIRLKHFS